MSGRAGRLAAAVLMACSGAAFAEPAPADARILVMPDALYTSTDLAALDAFAASCEAQESYDLAAEALSRAVTVAPDNPELRVRLAECQYKVGEAGRSVAFEQARSVSQLADAEPALRARALLVSGLIYFEQGMLPEAEKDFSDALSLIPGNVQAEIGLAAAEAARGDLRAASGRLDALGSASQPYDVETRYLLRWALTRFEQDRHVFPDSAEDHAAYGRLVYRAGRLPEAMMALRRAATQTATDPALWNLTAGIAAQLGQAAEVRAACEASLALNPDQPEIRQLLESLGPAQP
ncbi:MAG: Tetratricopeptide repeat [Candidatus Hydrogenedentota bacterium]|jgi:Flp pilus assembly protein TadD